MRPNYEPHDLPSLLNKVFRVRLDAFLKLLELGYFGCRIAQLCVIEYQRAGLPHAHLCLWVDKADVPRDGKDFDSSIVAEIHPLRRGTRAQSPGQGKTSML